MKIVRILHVADLHLTHAWYDWVASHCSEFDLLVIAGDLQNAFSQVPMHDQARAITTWRLSLAVPTVVCSGNHDYWHKSRLVSVDTYADAAWLRRLAGRGKLVVDGERVEIEGLSVAAIGWARPPDFRIVADIVVTHAPPADCPCASGAEGGDVGDPELWNAVKSFSPHLLLAGHVHKPGRLWCLWPAGAETTLVLVPGCDEQAEVPAHWIIDTDAQNARHSSGRIVSFEFPR